MIKECLGGGDNLQIHVVQKGESLSEIAKQYNTTIKQITLANELTEPDVLVVGEALIIPIPNQQYVVEPGDYLVGIAEKLGICLLAFTDANNIMYISLIYVGNDLDLH